jgi:hypothetical protein
MVKAMADAQITSFGCFAHTLQLIINDGVLKQAGVVKLLANCRRVVGHFKHSSVASCRLKQIQESLQLQQHQLKQDEPTRWNSSLYMLQSIVEQKSAIAAYRAETSDNKIPHLPANQIDLANKLIALMTPIEEITRSISSDDACISVVISTVRALS